MSKKNSKIKFTAVTIAWTEGASLQMKIKARAESKISVAWGNGRNTQHLFHTETCMDFVNYYSQRKIPLSGQRFHVEISAKNSDCSIIGFCMGGDMKIVDLDVSNCPELEHLYYFDYNHGEPCNLDLSRNVALKYLYCASNDLTSLDLSNNTALEVINCRSNRLSHLSLTNNFRLVELNCEYNEMKRLSIGYAPHLREANFEDGNHIDEATKLQIQYIIAENAENNLEIY